MMAQKNDDMMAALGELGLTGSLPERMYKYLASLGYTQLSISDRMGGVGGFKGYQDLITNGLPSVPTFPEKTFYTQDFTGIADGVTLRSLDGWGVYSIDNPTYGSRDEWKVQDGRIIRGAGFEEYGVPGAIIIGRDTGSTDHVFRTKFIAPSVGGSIKLAVAAVSEHDCVYLFVQNFGGGNLDFVLYKNVGGTSAQLFAQPGSTTDLGRALQSGDDVELRVLGQRVHLYVNGLRITPVDGVDLDTGGGYVKGTVVGFTTGTSVGATFDDVYVAGLSAEISLAATSIFWPASVSAGGRSVPVSGSYSGDVQALDYRVINSFTQVVVQDWARISSPSIAGGGWSANVFVPMCDTAVNPKVRVQVRAANDVDALVLGTETAVGICVGSYGQSNSALRGQAGATAHDAENAYTFSGSLGSEWIGGGMSTTARSQLWAAQIASASGIPCGVFVGGEGSKFISELNTRGAGWLDEMEALAATAGAYGYISSWLWTQGEAEAAAFAAFDQGAYRDEFDILLSELRGGISVASSVGVGICVIGAYGGTHVAGEAVGNANFSAVRECLIGLSDKPGVYVSTNLIGFDMADEWHYTPDSYVESGSRAGLSMAQVMGYGGYNGRGPLITGAARSAAVITLAVDLNGAESVAGTALTNYDVSLDGFATTLTISSAEVSGGNIVLTLSADPGGPVQVRSFYGMTYGTPTLAIGAYTDGTTIPVEPLFVPITSDS